MERTHLRSGALAGGTAVVLFTAVHHVLISSIWLTLPMMLIAGALCGLALAWNYHESTDRPTLATWIRFNGLYLVLLLLLGASSLVVFDPVTTMADVIAAGGAPDELFGRAMPLTAAFTVASIVLVTATWGWGWRQLVATSVTSVGLILLFGLNISTLGLVDVPGESAFVVVRFFALIVLLGVSYVGTFAILEWRHLQRSPTDGARTG